MNTPEKQKQRIRKLTMQRQALVERNQELDIERMRAVALFKKTRRELAHLGQRDVDQRKIIRILSMPFYSRWWRSLRGWWHRRKGKKRRTEDADQERKGSSQPAKKTG